MKNPHLFYIDSTVLVLEKDTDLDALNEAHTAWYKNVFLPAAAVKLFTQFMGFHDWLIINGHARMPTDQELTIYRR